MDDLDGQNAMLERLCRKHLLEVGDWDDNEDYVQVPIPTAMAALRELLLAVQERDAQVVDTNKCGDHTCHGDDARLIRAQTYSDLFPEEE